MLYLEHPVKRLFSISGPGSAVKYALTCMVLFFTLPAQAQEETGSYFQQKVDFEIDVTLNDVAHVLSGHIRINYTNHAPEALTRIPVHLYPNAYSSKETRFAEQQLRLGDLQFYYAPPEVLGGIDSLSFAANGKKLAMREDPQYREIIWLRLPTPLDSGGTISLESPFRVKIPKSFSRLGHVFQSYQITQWYPKPAVYDRNGWNLVPYLDQGEFYSDFGDYTVRITLPENYIVAATGELQDKDELSFLYERAGRTAGLPVTTGIEADPIPPSSGKMKTVEFRADEVTDFAWFADKRFRVDTSSVSLPNGQVVQTWAFYTKSESAYWEKATEYLNRSIRFYSDQVGSYDWPQVTAVQSPLSSGVGMEYPMITLIGLAFSPSALDQVITHEVGHNWFYGFLSSNERAFPWMDEGVNSLYEHLYMRKYYGEEGNAFIPRALSRRTDMQDIQALYFDLVRQGKLMRGGLDPFEHDGLSYYLNAYEIPALGLRLLREMMGPGRFQSAMQAYFKEWKMKHPGPPGFRSVFESYCRCDLDWFVNGLLRDGGIVDYAIRGIRGGTLMLENQGTIEAPVAIITHDNQGHEHVQWVPGFTGVKSVKIDGQYAGQHTGRIMLYRPENSPDVDWSDNTIRPSGLFSRIRPLKLRLVSGVEESDRTQLYLLPLLGINDADQGLAGLGLTNQKLPNPAFRWIIAPMLGLRSGDLLGMTEVRRNIKLRRSIFDRVMLRASLKRFNYLYDTDYGFESRYTKLELKGAFRFRRPDKFTSVDEVLSFRFAHLAQKYGVGLDIQEKLFAFEKRNYYVNEIRYSRISHLIIAPYQLNLTAQQGKGFLKFMASFRQKITYRKRSKGVYLHFFGGLLAQHDQPDANVNFLYNGQPSTGFAAKDYLFDEILLGRNATGGIFSQQVFLRDAELKTLSNAGISDSWMLGGGFSTSLPIPLPIHAYADFAIFPDPFNNDIRFSYSSGFSIVAAKDFLEIYFPVFESKDIRESVTYAERAGYFERVSFLFNLKALHPFDMGDHFFEFLYR